MRIEQLVQAKKICIAGYGAEGNAAEKFLRVHVPGVEIEIVERVYDVVEDNGAVWVISPGIGREKFVTIPAERRTSGSEIFFDSLSEGRRKSVIGITGTKGKSTTVKFLAELLAAAGKNVVAVGNYGVPLLNVFDDLEVGKYDYVVAELSSYQLENLRTSPGIAVLLNLFPDHLDRHGGVENYFGSKKNIFAYQKSGDVCLLPNFLTEKLDLSDVKSEVREFGVLGENVFPEDSVFRALHWRENFGAVREVLKLLNISEEVMIDVAKKFEGLAHRLEKFSNAKNRVWWDDAICTNPGAACATVRFFGEKLGALIVGGQARGMDVSPLADCLFEVAPRALVLVLESESQDSFLSKINGARLVRDFDEAVKVILANVDEGLNVVLCPGAPSYDRFRKFTEKGDAWQASVMKKNPAGRDLGCSG